MLKKLQHFKRTAYLRLLRLSGSEKEQFSPHGVTVLVPRGADAQIRYKLARGRPYEASEATLIVQNLKRDMPVIELGGCMGVISALIRNQIGPSAQHIVVEANSTLANFCRPNAMQGAAEGATEVIVAAVDYSGAETVNFSLGSAALSGRVRSDGGLSVPTTTLAKLAAKLPAGEFALICDIEGAEVPLVDNELELLGRVGVFVLETHPKLYPGKKDDVKALVAKIESTGLRCVGQIKDVFAFSRH